ncbi:MAG: PilZ domain-containing protein, partial [Proteobacteria bacterium]|nr:PilZ domain-containing protein [Pseudomonadota bacterium]
RCDEAIGYARELVSLERRGVAGIRPAPASLLAMLEAKRDEVVAGCSATDPSRTRSGSEPAAGSVRPPSSSPAPREEGRGDPEAEAGSDASWAWDPGAETGERTPPDDPQDNPQVNPETGRRPLRERLHCLVLLDPGGIRATLENISLGGLFLSTPRVRPPGSKVRVVLNTPEGPVQAEGVVRWSRDELVPVSPSPLGMGIEFTSNPPDLRSYLASRFPSLQMSRPRLA